MPVCEFGGFTLDTDGRRLTHDGRIVALTAKVFETLELLVEAGGNVVTRETFQQRLWPDAAVEERNLTVNVSTLRRALNEAGGGDYIETIPRIGYRLSVPVTVPASSAPIAAADMVEPSDVPTVSVRRWHRSVRLAFVAGVVVMATSIGASLRLGWPGSGQLAASSQSAIAVLPFVSSEDSGIDAGLGLGLADAVIAKLGGIDGVTVRPISSVMAYSKGGDPVSIGRALKVDRVVEGMVQRVGDTARVNARILDVATGATIWNERFERPYSGFFALQDTVSSDVAGTLLQRVAVEKRAGTVLDRPSSPEAYQAYLEGRMFSSRINTGTAPIDAAITAYQRSLALDANYAPAWSGLARAYRVRSFSHERRHELIALSKEAALKSLAIDPRHSEGYLVLGLLKYNFEWDWVGAGRDFQRAADLDPNSQDAFNWLGNLQRGLGEYNKAIASFERARAINPMAARVIQIMGEGLWFAGRIDEAIGMLEQSAKLDPSNPAPDGLRAAVFDSVGRGEEAMAAREKAARVRNDLAYLEGFRAARAKGYRAVLEFDLDWYAREHSLWETASLNAMLGRPEAALAALEECIADQCGTAPVLVTEPRLRSLHAEPRFRALAARVNLTGALARVPQ